MGRRRQRLVVGGPALGPADLILHPVFRRAGHRRPGERQAGRRHRADGQVGRRRRPGVQHVGHGDRHRRRARAARPVGGLHRQRVAGRGLVVQGDGHRQRPGAGVQREVAGIVARRDGVGHRAAVGRRGRHRAHVRGHRRVLRHAEAVGRRSEGGIGSRALVPKLLPGRRAVPVKVDRQRRVLAGRAEVPLRAPGRVDAAGAGRRLQLARRLARAPRTRRLAGGFRVPVAGRDRAPPVGLHQAARERRADRPHRVARGDRSELAEAHQAGGEAAARHRAAGVAGRDRPPQIEPHQPAHACATARHRARRITGGDRPPQVVPHQAPDAAAAAHLPTDVDATDHAAVVLAHQPAGDVAARDRHRPQPQVADRATLAHVAHQPHLLGRGPRDEQVRQRVAVALQRGRPRGRRVPQRHPARPAVPVRVVRVHRPVPVRVEVQVGGHLVAPAAADRAPHPVGCVREGRRVACVRGRSIPVQVPADRVELRQASHLDQAVVVGVVVHHELGHRDRHRRFHRAPAGVGGRHRQRVAGRGVVVQRRGQGQRPAGRV